MNVIEKLRSLVTETRERKNPIQFVEQWALAQRLLSRMPVDQKAVAAACRDRDLDTLDALVRTLEGVAAAPKPESAAPDISEADKAAAMRAFRKRLKLARLSDESKLGGRYTSGGKQSNIDAIEPPNEFPREVWKALEREGKLVHTGQGFYSLPDDAK